MNRFLLVEDDPTSRGFLLAASAALPADVDVADSLASAHALAARTPHDLWLIDANLPDGSGIELLARLRAEGLTTPAIAHTATREPVALNALREAGFARVLCKPLSAQAWRNAIREVLSRQQSASAPGDLPVGSMTMDAAPLWNAAAALAAVAGHAGNADALRGLFLGELPTMRDRIERAAGAHDIETVQAVLHKLRAGCGFVGADRLCRAAETLHAAPASPEALRDFLTTLDATRVSG